MGRIKYKVLFCSFCLDRDQEQVINEHSFDRSIDVSHLATPHIASNSSLRLSSTSTPIGDCSSDDSNDRTKHHHSQTGQASVPVNNNNPDLNNHPPEPPDRRDPLSEAVSNSLNSYQHDHGQLQPASVSSPPHNIYELQPSQEPQQQQGLPSRSHNLPQPSQGNNNDNLIPPANQRHVVAGNHLPDQNGSTTKLSYDIISVREPLAKILAERNQIQLAQLQQRQILGDHDYIEVYGERGSSCFYEEIAGSTTSSATYDQIGAISNHNYQVLINAYAVANRPNISQLGEGSNGDNNNNTNFPTNGLNTNRSVENFYDLTGSADQVDGSASSSLNPKPSTSFCPATDSVLNGFDTPVLEHPIPIDRTTILSQSIPVYSVINKATRRSNAIIRATINSCRPPQPPPKNLTMAHKASTSAMQTNSINTIQPGSKVSSQIPNTSSYLNNINNSNEFPENQDHQRAGLPQPPPRYSKLHMYNAINRPLPLPDTHDTLDNNEGTVIEGSLMHDEDIESIDNGYELLTTNFDDDQIDVGYEKIRESNRYSGGSLSSQFCPLQAIDNGGYESVQPVYSSPSDALAEPNYEAIGPTTASELAAAATAKLTAAAAVIEQFLKQDQS